MSTNYYPSSLESACVGIFVLFSFLQSSAASHAHYVMHETSALWQLHRLLAQGDADLQEHATVFNALTEATLGGPNNGCRSWPCETSQPYLLASTFGGAEQSAAHQINV